MSNVGPSVPVREFRLSNGLRVFSAPMPGAATASVWVWYPVGSKNEWPGVTGISHWVEHMLFNGSPNFPKGAMDRAIMEVGGYLNAFTDVDCTAYLSQVPAEYLDLPLRIEADRMTRARMSEAEVERERKIVLSERDGAENWPEFRAEEELYELAFRHHPYQWDALGFRTDIQTMNAKALAQYYQRFYGPRNAVLVLAGGFEGRAAERRVRELFGQLPSTGESPVVAAREPPQNGERRAEMHGPGTTPFVLAGYRAPAFDDPATPATVLLDMILGGDSRIFAGSPWGPGPDHPSARLYRKLVAPGLAVSASTEFRPREHPGLFAIHVQAVEGVDLDRIEAVVDRELASLAKDGPTAGEIAEAREKVVQAAPLAYEGPRRTAFRVGMFAISGGLSAERRLYRRLLELTRRDVRDQAREVFRTTSRSVVRYEPTGGVDAH